MIANPKSLPPQVSATGRSFFSRYREVFLAIAIFLALDVGVLIFNVQSARVLRADSLRINLAGRQRLLSQEIAKNTLELQAEAAQNLDTTKTIKELNHAYDLFDSTLKGFDLGGFVTDANNQQRSIAAIDSPEGRAALEKGKAIWQGFQPLLRPLLLSSGATQGNDLAAAVAYSQAHNLELLAQMNRMTGALQISSENRAGLLQTIQACALVAIVFNFAFILYDFLTKIRRSDREIAQQADALQTSLTSLEATTRQLSSAKAESDAILETVQEGLLLMNSRFEVAGQYSEALKAMFRTEDLAGYSVLKLLQRLLTEKDFNTDRDYLEMLFDPQKREKTLSKINPMDQAEVHFQEKNATFTTRYYQFHFRRIYDGDKIERVFTSIRDITAQVQMSQRLKEAEERKERQLTLLLDVVNIPVKEVAMFCSKTVDSIDEINRLLKAEDFIGKDVGKQQDPELRRRLDGIFRAVHSIKGHAGALGLSFFVKKTHDFEEEIRRIKSRPKLSGEDFIGIVTFLSDLKTHVQECEELQGKLSANTANSATTAAAAEASKEPESNVVGICQRLVENLRRETGCDATLEVKLADDLAMPKAQEEAFRQILIQFIKNSFAHGLETPNERTKVGKPGTGNLQIELQAEPGFLKLVYSDDGRGLEAEKIRAQCIKRGLLEAAQASALKETELWPYIFEPGFSTRPQADQISGRGIGLDIVRDLVMVRHAGRLALSTAPGQFTRFFVTLPI